MKRVSKIDGLSIRDTKVLDELKMLLGLKTLPKYPGMNWKVITGSHDQSHTFNYGPFDFGKELEKRRMGLAILDKKIANVASYTIDIRKERKRCFRSCKP